MSIIRQQLLLSTEFAESAACHSVDKFGFFTIASKIDGPHAWQQHSYRLNHLPRVLQSIGSRPDTYISQAEFSSPNRRIANLARVGLMWVDLDIYDIPALAGVRVENVAQQLLQACDDRQLPPPSVIIDSGMGLYAKWFLTTPIPARALSRWQLVQNILCDRLSDFGADANARDASRVLRIVNSVHSGSGRPVTVLWENTVPTHGGELLNGVVAYSFDMLADDLLPLTRERLAELRAERAIENSAKRNRCTSTGQNLTLVKSTKGLRPFIASQLAWDRYNDIAKLAKIRGWTHGAPIGQRDMPVFLSAALMAQAIVVPHLSQEVIAIAKKFAPTWSKAEIQSCVASVLSRAVAASKGEKLEYKGRQVDPRYIFRTDTLLTLLDITAEEEAQMTTIIGKSEARRRDAERSKRAREHAGAVSRETYEAAADARRKKAKEIREAGRSWAEVGAELGITATAARLLANRASDKRSSPSVYM